MTKTQGNRRFAYQVSVVALVLVATAACGGGSSAGSGGAPAASQVAKEKLSAGELQQKAAKEGKVVWYVNTNTEAVAAVVDAFEKKYPKIKVETQRQITFKLWQKFQQEQAAGRHIADVFTQSTWGITNTARKQDLITPYKPKVAKDKYPDYIDSKTGTFSGRVITQPLVYNTQKVPPQHAPKTWKDLLNPWWKGELGVLDPSENAYGFENYWQMAHSPDLGKKYFEELAKNKPKMYTQSGQQATALVSGEVLAASIVAYRARAAIKGGAPLKIVYPKTGVGVSVNFDCLVTQSPHPYASRLFLDFLASSQGQEARMKGVPDFPTNPDAKLVFKGQPELSDLHLLDRQPEKMFKQFDQFNKWFANVMK